MVGASLTGVTVRVKARFVDPKLGSLAVEVIVAVPVWFVAGANVIGRLVGEAPMPSTILASGKSVGLEEVAVNVNPLATVSSSRTVKGRAVVDVSSAMV